MEGLLNLQHFGAQLRARNGMFSVFLPDLTGAGNNRTEEIAPSHLQTILLHPRTSLSTDAALLADRNGVACLILDEAGEPAVFLAGNHTGRSLEIWKRQLLLHNTPQGLGFAREWLCQKVRRKLEWLPKLKSYRQDQPDALQTINATNTALQEILVKMSNLSLLKVAAAAAELRGLEGYGQKVYLAMINALLPVQYKFDGRSRLPSTDLFNAQLNYGYGILYHWVERALWESGANPYFGFLHTGERKQKALLYDFIEPYRPWVDRVVFKLCASKAITWSHTETRDNGGVWLTAEGRKLLAKAVYEKFREKKMLILDRKWTIRQSIIQEANRFASGIHQMHLMPSPLPALSRK